MSKGGTGAGSPRPHAGMRGVVPRLVRFASVVSLVLSLRGADGSRARSHRTRRVLIPSYDVLTTGFSQGDIWSPDLRYIARARIGEASALTLTVVDNDTQKPLARLEDVAGFVWVPGRPHRLVVAACGEYGDAFLGMWEGGRAWRSLRPVRRPQYECYRLHGVTPDGSFIVYGYDPDINAPGGPREKLLARRIRLRLPAR